MRDDPSIGSKPGVAGRETLGDRADKKSDSGLATEELGVTGRSSVPVELILKEEPWMRINSPLPMLLVMFVLLSSPDSMFFMESDPRVPMLVVAISCLDLVVLSTGGEMELDIFRLIFSLGEMHFSIDE